MKTVKLIIPELLYRVECRKLASSDEQLLLVLETKILRMICLYQRGDIVKKIRSKGLIYSYCSKSSRGKNVGM